MVPDFLCAGCGVCLEKQPVLQYTNNVMDAYRFLAAVYDRCMYDVDYSEWYEYIHSLLCENGVSGEILEMACGTGSMTVFLARDYDVIAADSSEEMLGMAEEKLMRCGLRAHFVSADMNSFVREKKADAVVSCMDGVNYLTGGPSGFFRCAYSNLRPGGTIMFDISSESKLRGIADGRFFYDDSDDYTYLWTNELRDNLLYMNIAMFVRERENHYRRFDECHVQRIYSADEIKAGLEEAGFADIRAYDFMTRDEPGPESLRIQFTGRKSHE